MIHSPVFVVCCLLSAVLRGRCPVINAEEDIMPSIVLGIVLALRLAEKLQEMDIYITK